MQLILEQNLSVANVVKHHGERKIGLFTSIFGCWHKRLTRPFTTDRNTYMACLECGARKKVDTKNFKVSRAFYYPPSVPFDRN
ncbi:MAG: hypothetical protein AB7F88_01775 [Pyrinomonadaceae bacterium]